MGGDMDTFAKDRQMAAQRQIAKFLKALSAFSGRRLQANTESARAKFVNFGGDAAVFEQERRKGAGGEAAMALKVCLKSAATKTEASQCTSTACDAQVAAGGAAADCWFDRKRG